MAERRTYVIPVSNGIFEHCQRIGVAVWVFLWMVDHTTKEVAGTDEGIEGLVYGGRAIRARDVARDLQMSTRTVHVHLARLLDGGYLRKINHGDGMPSGYSVLKSKKWAKQYGSPPSHDSAFPSHKKVGGAKDSAPLYRNNSQQHKTETTTRDQMPVPFTVPNWMPLDSWNAFLEMRRKKGKNPTDFAKKLLVRELERLGDAGQDPGAVLDQSTRNAWTDLYEARNSQGAQDGRRRNFNRAEEALHSAIASGRAALASLAPDCESIDEIGRDDR
jgi:hypothetical protein